MASIPDVSSAVPLPQRQVTLTLLESPPPAIRHMDGPQFTTFVDSRFDNTEHIPPRFSVPIFGTVL